VKKIGEVQSFSNWRTSPWLRDEDPGTGGTARRSRGLLQGSQSEFDNQTPSRYDNNRKVRDPNASLWVEMGDPTYNFRSTEPEKCTKQVIIT